MRRFNYILLFALGFFYSLSSFSDPVVKIVKVKNREGVEVNLETVLKFWLKPDKKTRALTTTLNEMGIQADKYEVILVPEQRQKHLSKGLVSFKVLRKRKSKFNPAAKFLKHKGQKVFYMDLETGLIPLAGNKDAIILSGVELQKLIKKLGIVNTFQNKNNDVYMLNFKEDVSRVTDTYNIHLVRLNSNDLLESIRSYERDSLHQATIKQSFVHQFLEYRLKDVRKELENIREASDFQSFSGVLSQPSFKCEVHKQWLDEKFNTSCIKSKLSASNHPVFILDPGHLGGKGFCDQRAVNKYGRGTHYSRDPNDLDHYREGHGTLFMALRARNMIACMMNNSMWTARKSIKLTREGSLWMYDSSRNLKNIFPNRGCSTTDSLYNRSYRTGYIKSLVNRGADYVFFIHTNANNNSSQFPKAFSPKTYHARSHTLASKVGLALKKYMYGKEKSQWGWVSDRQRVLGGRDISSFHDRYFGNTFFFRALRGYSAPRVLAETFFHDTPRVALMLAEKKTEREVATNWVTGATEIVKASPVLHYGAESIVGSISSALGCGL